MCFEITGRHMTGERVWGLGGGGWGEECSSSRICLTFQDQHRFNVQSQKRCPKTGLILLTNCRSAKESFNSLLIIMKINKVRNCFNEYHMGKQNELAMKKNQKSPFERMATVSLFITNGEYKHIAKNTHCQKNLKKNILAFCQLTRISLDFNLSIKRHDLMVYEQLCREKK